MIATVTLNPSVDQHLTVERLIKGDALRASQAQWFAGGKGVNVARVVKELKGQACAFGFSGGFPGKMLEQWLDDAGISHHFLKIAEPTRINTTVMDLSDQTQTHFRAPGPRIGCRDLDRLFRQMVACRPRPRYWVVGGSLPPGTPSDFYKHLIFELEKMGGHCVLDADDQALIEGIDATPFLIKPNEQEFKRLTGVNPSSDKSILAASRKLVHRGIGVVMTTLGPRGAVVVTHNDAFRLDTPPVKVRSKIGAGDSTIAGLLVALEQGASLRQACRMGVAAGTAAVLAEGTRLCERSQVIKMLPKIKIRSL